MNKNADSPIQNIAIYPPLQSSRGEINSIRQLLFFVLQGCKHPNIPASLDTRPPIGREHIVGAGEKILIENILDMFSGVMAVRITDATFVINVLSGRKKLKIVFVEMVYSAEKN